MGRILPLLAITASLVLAASGCSGSSDGGPDDVGPADLVVQEGMVFTIEPGIYIRDEDPGIRLEDNVLVQESGNINLMANIPIDPDEIEELMNS